MHKVLAIQKKQWKETLKNREVFIQFVMFPVIALIMTQSVKSEEIPANYFVTLFAAMYIGMAPLTSAAAIISEEKEKNILSILRLSNVTALQYLLSIGGYIILMCLAGSLGFVLIGGYSGGDSLLFIFAMMLGTVVSTLIGAAIGLTGQSQMSAAATAVPVMLVFSFLPMIAQFNEPVKKIADYVYSQQISNILTNIGNTRPTAKSFIIIGVNLLLAAVVFVIAYRRNK